MTIDGAYSGLKVLDLGQGIAAPYCAMLLAMHGADVIKLEPPAGDWSRGRAIRVSRCLKQVRNAGNGLRQRYRPAALSL